MGLTPLEGVVMGTRSGNIDPAIVEFIAKKENLDLAGVMNVLNKKSGLQGMSGVGSDMRDIRAAIEAGNEDAKNAYDVSAMVSLNSLAGYVAAMNGVDAIVFTAGIGENVGDFVKMYVITLDTSELRSMTLQTTHWRRNRYFHTKLQSQSCSYSYQRRTCNLQRYSSAG